VCRPTVQRAVQKIVQRLVQLSRAAYPLGKPVNALLVLVAHIRVAFSAGIYGEISAACVACRGTSRGAISAVSVMTPGSCTGTSAVSSVGKLRSRLAVFEYHLPVFLSSSLLLEARSPEKI